MEFKILKRMGSMLLLGALLFFPGCKKFLDEQPPSNFQRELFLQYRTMRKPGWFLFMRT